jgi:UDP-3-O-[3-hydroxymyristoyl] N-acetylglucosamine deacetylase
MGITICNDIQFSGISLHLGVESKVIFHPSNRQGIRFLFQNREIEATYKNTIRQKMATVISSEGVQLFTIEHMMAAIYAAGITDLDIELFSPEPPILDGSAKPFWDNIHNIGLCHTDSKVLEIYIKRKVSVSEGKRFVSLLPSEDSRYLLTSSIDFSHIAPKTIGKQSLSVDIEDFAQEIAPARTFGFVEHLEELKKQNLAMGASLSNVIAIEKDELKNPPLRFPDEMIRHKILDAIGDLALSGGRLRATYNSYAGSHALNSELLKSVFKDRNNYELIES